MKLYSNSTIVLACIAYMILPAISNFAASGNLQAKSETHVSTKERKDIPAPATPSPTSKQRVIIEERKDQKEQLASRSVESRRNNWSVVVETSKKYIGVPYASGGKSSAGFDCSGFVQYVYNKHGLLLPRTSSAMFNMGTRVTNLNPGDLVFFNTSGAGVSHVGIYIGNSKFISATSKGVKIDHLHDSYWSPKYLGAKRV